MRKLKLDLDQLTVDSFATAADGVRWGTVRAASDEPGEETMVDEEANFLSWLTCQTRCNQNTCGGSCGVSCATCVDPTCDSCYITKCRDNCA